MSRAASIRRVPPLALAAASLALALVATACGSEPSPTQVMLRVDAEPGVRAAAARLRVRIYGGVEGTEQPSVLRGERVYDLPPGDPGPGEVRADWPVLVAIAPIDHDATRVYGVLVEALDGAGATVASARVISGFVPSQNLGVRVLLEDACATVPTCGLDQTCRSGACVSARVDETQLPRWCPEGQADFGGRCVASHECEASCGANASCAPPTSGFLCVCEPGYVRQGTSCAAPDGGMGTTCPAPVAPENGSVSLTTGAVEYATYTCGNGFVLAGNGGATMRTCQSDATWSGTDPTCEPIVGPCQPNPCANGGSCAVDGEGYVCDCANTGYTGATCTTSVCPSGYYLPAGGSCTPWTTCSSGQYQVTAPTATTNRVCASCTTCTLAEFQTQACANGNAPQDRTCSPLTNCTTGQYMVSAPTSTSNRVCASCSPACSIGQYEAQACADGNAYVNRQCGDCESIPSCASDVTCTSSSNSQCTSCEPGYMLVNGTADTCEPEPGTCTLYADADGYFSEWQGSNGYGTQLSTYEDNNYSTAALVHFDVVNGACEETGASIPYGAVIDSALLVLNREGGCESCPPQHQVERITSSWSEGSISTPSTTGSARAIFTPSSSGTVMVGSAGLATDVQAFRNGTVTNRGWLFRPTDAATSGSPGNPFRFSARESGGATRPRLVITYTP